MPKATLIYFEKNHYQNKRYILEAKIWQVLDARYRDGVKYSLVFIDTKTCRRVLMDNHHPKGYHIHLDSDEFGYDFKNEATLVADFKAFIFQHFGVML